MFTQKFKITNLDCPACVQLSEGVLQDIPGVKTAKVDLQSGSAEITSEREVSWEEIVAALKTVEKEAAKI